MNPEQYRASPGRSPNEAAMNKFSKHNVNSTKKILGVKSVSVKKLHGYGYLEEIVVKRADRRLYKSKKEIEFKEPYTPSYKPPGAIYEDQTKHKRVMWADELYKFSNETLKKVQDELHHRNKFSKHNVNSTKKILGVKSVSAKKLHGYGHLEEIVVKRADLPTNDQNITTTTSGDVGAKSGRTVTFTTEDIQRKKNDVKARTTLLLSLPDEHQLRFSKYKTERELWAVILKTFGGKATKKRKKNVLKKQYGNFKAEGSESLEQTFNRLQRNRSDLDTMSLDNLYNHLKVYESEVQKKSDLNSHNIAFISSAKHISGNEDENTACVSTASTIFPTASANTSKALMEIDGVGWDWSYMANEREDYALVADEEAPKEFALMANTSTESKVFDNSLCSKNCLLTASKDLDNLIESQRSEKNKEGLGYTAVPPSTAQLYLSPKKDLSWTGLPECADDTVSDYSRPSPTVESTSEDNQNRNSSASEDVASPITPKTFVKFMKPKDCQSESKTDKKETPKKLPVKYAEQYRKSNKKPSVRGNQRNWNNLKSYQLGLDFVMKNKACFNCGNFTHLANDCRKRVKRGTSRSQNNAFKSPSHRPIGHRPYGPPVRPMRSSMNVARPNRTFFNIQAHSYETRPFLKTTTVKSQFRAPWVPTVNRNNPPVNRKFSTGCRNFPTANRKFLTARRKFPTGRAKIHTADMGRKRKAGKPSAYWIWKPTHNLSNKGPNNNSGSSQNKIDNKGYWDNGCSRHMTGNISYLSDFEPYDGGYVSFGQGGCKIIRKGTIKMGKLKFENVYFVKNLKYNLFSVSQICDNKNSVLFTDSECIVLGRDFKLLDDANILLRTPRQHNMYSIDLNNIVSHKDLTCLVANASADECILWHRRLGHLNFKTMNKLVRHNLVRGLPTNFFENDHTFTACLKGKQHKATCKSKLVNSVTKPLHTLHMDLFGPTSVSSISHKWYCLVMTDDFSRFTWTFFLKSKDETSGILKKFITEIENLKDLKVKIIRCDNRGEFKNKEINDFCSQKGIKREFSNARTPQQNSVAERRNRTLIEEARTMLADVKLPVTFWAEAVNTACYVQNMVLVNKPHNKTPYELFNGRSPAIGFLKPFGCHVMILNTLDNLEKFEEKWDEEKGEHNTNFHPMVDFLEASHLRIETTEEGTKILATVDGIVRTVSESSLRRNLKLRDEEGISSLPDAELFENLTLIGYNISPNQKFTFQKGQFSHQWKYLIHTIMQCLSPKSIGFNEFISNIATATVVTPYSRRKGKEVMVESDTPKKQKLQEQIDAQSMIDGLDRNNKTITKYLQEYQQFAAELPLERRIELISDLEEAERYKRKGMRFDQESSKKLKSLEEVVKEAKSTAEIPKEKIKEMMQLIPIEEVYVEALQVKHPIIDWKVHTDGQKSYWKIIRLGGSSACYQFFVDLLKHLDRDDLNQLWALVKEYLSIRPASSDKEMELWLYDLCGVHQVTAKDKEIFMLVEKDYPLRMGLALVMICYKLQVENFSHMTNDIVLKIYKIANSPRQQGD
nr:putative ribonuclease H-like domain-containing protein [Tanacetum cinerariifolium]